MTQDEIRKLLGGYATDTLTESERAALFEAALEDQELFDALHNEDALRELLADPVTREQIRNALRPAGLGRSPAWWKRGWLVGTASLAVAAGIAIAVVVWQRPPIRPAPVVQTMAKLEPKVEAPPPVEPRRVAPKNLRKYRPKAVAPAPPAAGLVLPEQQQQVLGQQQGQDQNAVVNGVIGGVVASAPVPPPRKQALAPTFAADAVAPLYEGPLVRYSVLRSKAADTVRIEIVSQVPGYMALYRADADGQWQRVYPVNDAEVAIAANTAYQIPEVPIAVRDKREKLRLVIEPAAGPSFGAQLATGSLNAPRAKALDKKAAGPVPLVIEIPIGPGVSQK